MTHEEWRDIADYEGIYQVSNLGRIRSVDRVVYFNQGKEPNHIKKGAIKSISRSQGASPYVKLSKNGVNKRYYIWKIVINTFFECTKEQKYVFYIDGDRNNNCVDNLIPCTKDEYIKLMHAKDFPRQLHGEIWQDIPEYKGYQASNIGRIRSVARICEGEKRATAIDGRILSQNKNDKGYKRVLLRKDGKGVTALVHRLVALAFIPNPEEKPEVDHINALRDDNRVENLRWVTRQENNHHRDELGHCYNNTEYLNSYEVKKIQIEATSKPIIRNDGKRYKSIKDAALDLGYSTSASIRAQLRGLRKTCKGYTFAYENEHDIPRTKRRKVAQINKETGEILKIFDSVSDAIKEFNNTGIRHCLYNSERVCSGFKWRYIE